MRWIYYLMCWLCITESIVSEFNRTWNLIFLLPSLAGVAAMAYCLVQYQLHPEEQIYLLKFEDTRVQANG